MTNLNLSIENKIKEKALIYMKQARPDWNVPHLFLAVANMKKLLKLEGGNPKILIPAIYLHDIGYAGMLSKGYNFDGNQKVKENHMLIGYKMCKRILNELGAFSDAEIDKISNLVLIHDDLDKINGNEIQLVFEADSLAQLDVEKVKPNFDKENFLKFLDYFIRKRSPLFKTKTGKKALQQLLPKAKSYFD